MQKLKSQQMQKLIRMLKKHLKNNIEDIFIIGSILKDKIEPRDIDIIVLFKERKMKEVENELYLIKEDVSLEKVHIEPIFTTSMFSEKIFLTILHEGYSLKYKKKLSEVLGIKAYSVFYYNLKNLSKIDKVRFAQTLYGRKKNGLLYQEKGISLGQGSFMIPVEREEVFKELMKKWKVKFNYKRAFVSD